MISGVRLPTAVFSPEAFATWRSATRPNCSMVMRIAGSTLDSLEPSVATEVAIWRAVSHAWLGADDIMRNRSPKNGREPNGSSPPSGPWSLMGAS